MAGYGQDGDVLILLLSGGDKRTQRKDIEKACATATRADRPFALLAEGDLVVLVTMQEHTHPSRVGRTYTTTWFDMFRVADGRLVEHWDSAQKNDAAAEPAR